MFAARYSLPNRCFDMMEDETVTLRELMDAGEIPFKVDTCDHYGTEYAMIRAAYCGMCADLIDYANHDAVEAHYSGITHDVESFKGIDLDEDFTFDELSQVFELLEWQYVRDSALLDESIYSERVERSRVEEWEFTGRKELADEVIKLLGDLGNFSRSADELSDEILNSVGESLEYEVSEGVYWPSAELRRGAGEYLARENEQRMKLRATLAH